ncbi:hypothetical protein AB0N62_29580 [Streptomyces sp. NPDC093982]|uniref:hypothetical protein n=1 Tax=Streptomyces sp. NPDC093982 TaxID=3155077 RepID=UPI00341EFFD5
MFLAGTPALLDRDLQGCHGAGLVVVHRQLGAPIILIWDNLGTHLGVDMRRFIAGQDWLTVVQLTAYAPEPNPVEGIPAGGDGVLARLPRRTGGRRGRAAGVRRGTVGGLGRRGRRRELTGSPGALGA